MSIKEHFWFPPPFFLFMKLIQLHFTLFARRVSILIEFVPHCLPHSGYQAPQLGKFPPTYLPLIPLTQDMMITIIAKIEDRPELFYVTLALFSFQWKDFIESC